MIDLPLTAREQQLCNALRALYLPVATGPGEALRRVAESNDTALFAAALANDVAAPVAHAMANVLGGLSSVPLHWRVAHEAVFTQITDYLVELDLVAERLADAGIPLVALKNGGIARGIYPCPGCCPMGDLDVLVQRRHFRQAHDILLDCGYRFEFRSELEEADLDAAEHGGGAEYHKQLPNGIMLWLELQWRAVAGRWIRPDQEPSADELMARSIAIPGTAVRMLAPEDNLLQVALHTAKHSYVRAPGFRLHLDVERIVRGYPDLDWDRFVAQAMDLQVKTPVYFSLAIAHQVLNTPIPQEVLAQLRPAAWKEQVLVQQIGRAGLFNPDESKFTRVGYILFTSLLYDDATGLARGVFPDPAWMRNHYEVQRDALLPYFYGRRLADLVLRRART